MPLTFDQFAKEVGATKLTQIFLSQSASLHFLVCVRH